MQAGGNDLNAGKTPQQVLADFQALATKVRTALPDVRIVYLSSSPSPARWSQAESQLEMNWLVKEYISAGKNLDYIESYNAFLGAGGKPPEELFVADGLHHNAEGYKIRASLVKPHLP